MKISNPYANLTKFEWTLWMSSIFAVLLSFFLSGMQDVLSTIASLIGVSALILLARGAWQGQVLCIVFAALYGIVSIRMQYYGEMLTYLCMSLPMAVISLISWVRHPFKESNEVEVARLSKRILLVMVGSAAVVTTIFFFLLRALGNAALGISTVSITTSYVAAFLTFCRSPYYALGYALNDIVLITLWIIAAVNSPSSSPMVICFVMFFFNDMYAFFNWCRMQKKQAALAEE